MENVSPLVLTFIAAVVAVLVAIVVMSKPGQVGLGASPTQFLNLTAPTTTSSLSVTTSARILATTTSTTGTSYTRMFATVCNPNSNPVALFLGGDIPANSSTGRITTWIAAAAGYDTCYEITDRNGYNGSVTASSTNGTATTITVTDYVN